MRSCTVIHGLLTGKARRSLMRKKGKGIDVKKVAVLGSTGSIGMQTLEVVRTNQDITITALAAGSNIERLEEQIRGYENAVVEVSHDRFFLDRTAQVVYELEDGILTRYPGNYTAYKEEKAKRMELQRKAYERQKEEEERLLGLVA